MLPPLVNTHQSWSEANHIKHLMRQRDLKKIFLRLSSTFQKQQQFWRITALLFLLFFKKLTKLSTYHNIDEKLTLSISSRVSDDWFLYNFGLYYGRLCASCQFKFWCKFTKYSPRTEYLPENLLQHCGSLSWCIYFP